MSESNDKIGPDLPRVKIIKSDTHGAIEVNFKEAYYNKSDISDTTLKILELTDDWTSQCLGTMRFAHEMAATGHFIAERVIDNNTIKFLTDTCISHEEVRTSPTETTYSFIFHNDDIPKVQRGLSNVFRMMDTAKSIQKSNLSSLVANFDTFIAKFIKILVSQAPEKVVDLQESVKIEEVVRLGGIENVLQSRASKVIDQKLRGSHFELISWILETFNIVKNPSRVLDDKIFKGFIEVCQRRHLIIHNGGLVNENYVQNCEKAKTPRERTLEINTEADVSEKYLKGAAARTYLTGFYIAHLYLQNCERGSPQNSYTSMLTAAHDFLLDGRTKMCRRICEFAMESRKKMSNDMVLRFAINQALSYLYDPALTKEEQNSQARSVLKSYDWSVITPDFELALAAVRREEHQAIKLARKAHESGRIGYAEATTWCVFKEFRKIPGFLECFPRAPLMLAEAKSD